MFNRLVRVLKAISGLKGTKFGTEQHRRRTKTSQGYVFPMTSAQLMRHDSKTRRTLSDAGRTSLNAYLASNYLILYQVLLFLRISFRSLATRSFAHDLCLSAVEARQAWTVVSTVKPPGEKQQSSSILVSCSTLELVSLSIDAAIP